MCVRLLAHCLLGLVCRYLPTADMGSLACSQDTLLSKELAFAYLAVADSIAPQLHLLAASDQTLPACPRPFPYS